MGKIVFLFQFLFFSCLVQSQEEKIFLDPCMKLSVIYYTDNSGSMDSAVSDMHRWARSAILIPGQQGYVETSLISFDECYQIWCMPTSNRTILTNAVGRLCATPTGNATEPHHGLEEIRKIFAQRLATDSTERQVLLIHSDYHWQKWQEAVAELKQISAAGVLIVLSLPRTYDGNTRGYDIHEGNLSELKDKVPCTDVRSNFSLFKKFLEWLRAIVPCG